MWIDGNGQSELKAENCSAYLYHQLTFWLPQLETIQVPSSWHQGPLTFTLFHYFPLGNLTLTKEKMTNLSSPEDGTDGVR